MALEEREERGNIIMNHRFGGDAWQVPGLADFEVPIGSRCYGRRNHGRNDNRS